MKPTSRFSAIVIALAAMAWQAAIAQDTLPVQPTAEATEAKPVAPIKDPFAIVRDAQSALKAEKFGEAEQLLSQAMTALPNEASLPYNLGVARFRQGNFEGAAEAFTRAAEIANDPNLAARSAFNQGTATYAQALKNMEQGVDPAAMADPLKQSVDLVGNSLEQLKHAIEANPDDRDARANAELAHRLLKQLQEMQQQQQQQQQQQGDQSQQHQDQQQQNQQNQQDQSQDQQQSQSDQSQQQDSEQNQSQQQQQQDENQEQQQSESQQNDQGEEDQQQQSQQGEDQQQEEPQPDEGEGQGDAKPRDGALSREQAERLLQMVRDKQRERRAELAKQQSKSRTPVAKDW